MGCSAKIRPFPNDTELQCELEDESHETHESVLRNYAYPGSETRMTWLDSDRRTFRGNWVPCPWDEGVFFLCSTRGTMHHENVSVETQELPPL